MNSNFAMRSPRQCALLLAFLFAITTSVLGQTPSVGNTLAPSVSNTLASQSSATPSATPSPTPSLERRFLKNILRDQVAIYTFPLHLKRSDARWLVPLGLSTAALITTDPYTARLSENRTRIKVSRDISHVGSGYGTGVIAGVFYLIGRKQNNARARETGILGAQALIDSASVALALKFGTQRPRPRKDIRGEFFKGGRSFPSGHAIGAWSLATVIANEYKDRPFVRFAAYGGATAVSVARFTGRNHFLSDVFAGSLIGYGIGRYVYRTHHDPALDAVSQEAPRAPSKLIPLVIPRYERGARNYGVAFVWSF